MRIAETWSITSTTRPHTFSGKNRTQRFSTGGCAPETTKNQPHYIGTAMATDRCLQG